jgi:hypothetical protein
MEHDLIKFPPLNPMYCQHDVETYLRWLIAKVAYNSTVLMQDDRWVREIHEYIKKSPDFVSEQLFEALNEYKAMKISNPATSENVESVLTAKYSQLTGCSSDDSRDFVKNWRADVLKQLTDTQTLSKLDF